MLVVNDVAELYWKQL